MVLVNDIWFTVNDLDDVVSIIKDYYNYDLGREMDKLISEYRSDAYYVLEKELDNAEMEIGSLNNEIYDLENQIEDLETEIAELKDEIDELQFEF